MKKNIQLFILAVIAIVTLYSIYEVANTMRQKKIGGGDYPFAKGDEIQMMSCLSILILILIPIVFGAGSLLGLLNID